MNEENGESEAVCREGTQEKAAQEKKKRAPGGGRKKKESTFFKEASAKILEAHPKTVEVLINMAHGVARKVKCPACKHEFEVKLGDKADREALVHLDNRIQGKPKNISEVDMMQRIEMTSTQLVKMYHLVLEYQVQVDDKKLAAAKADFEAIPVPDLSDIDKVKEQEAMPMPMMGAGVPQPVRKVNKEGMSKSALQMVEATTLLEELKNNEPDIEESTW